MSLIIQLALAAMLTGVAWPAALSAQAAAEPDRNPLFPIDPKAYLLGKFNPDTTMDFVQLPAELTDGRSAYLRTAVAEALAKMVSVAEEAGIRLTVVSATRNYATQRSIWNAKFTGTRLSNGQNLAQAYPDTTERCLAILQYSAAPGLSRHHWGTEVDFNSTAQNYWSSANGVVTLQWLEAQADKFGFYMAYPPGRDEGYRYEPWHWSYMPIARPLVRRYYDRFVTTDDLKGFLGAAAVRALPWKEWYVYGVNASLK